MGIFLQIITRLIEVDVSEMLLVAINQMQKSGFFHSCTSWFNYVVVLDGIPRRFKL